jgi:hypothetical protein
MTRFGAELFIGAGLHHLTLIRLFGVQVDLSEIQIESNWDSVHYITLYFEVYFPDGVQVDCPQYNPIMNFYIS